LAQIVIAASVGGTGEQCYVLSMLTTAAKSGSAAGAT
jgi:hypothetical protein